jgi:hypothetical protein
MNDYERGLEIQRKRHHRDAMMIGAISNIKTSILKFENRGEGTIGDIVGLKIATELLLEACKDWG